MRISSDRFSIRFVLPLSIAAGLDEGDDGGGSLFSVEMCADIVGVSYI